MRNAWRMHAKRPHLELWPLSAASSTWIDTISRAFRFSLCDFRVQARNPTASAIATWIGQMPLPHTGTIANDRLGMVTMLNLLSMQMWFVAP